MRNKAIIRKLTISLLLPLAMALIYVSKNSPALVERLYSEGIYLPIGQVLSRVTGILPFSVAELLFLLVPAAFIVYTIILLIKLFKGHGSSHKLIIEYAVNILLIISLGFFSFVGLWGLNYYRMPFASIAGLEVRPASIDELESTCQALIERANALRASVSKNSEGTMDIPGSSRDILNDCYRGYEVIASRYPALAGSYGNPKPILLSELMNYTGICGIYFPFTGEANVNVSIPESSLPSTAAHEMAHQRGFSREDEANYISYLACTAHPDANYKYSGILLALANSMNALHQSDQALFQKTAKGYSEGVLRDLMALNGFWKQYEGPVERTSSKINNTYLKANNQKDGVKSYGRMVDLLIAEHRQAGR